jgi:hypothetical protein
MDKKQAADSSDRQNDNRLKQRAAAHSAGEWRTVQENSVIPGAHRATKAMLLGLVLIWLIAQLTIVLIHHFRMTEAACWSHSRSLRVSGR